MLSLQCPGMREEGIKKGREETLVSDCPLLMGQLSFPSFWISLTKVINIFKHEWERSKLAGDGEIEFKCAQRTM